MAEVQKSTNAGETTQHFIQFVMMQQQQALHALGRHPNRPAGAPGTNLDLAKAFIDQLAAIRTRTEGNLSPDEAHLLTTVIVNLETAYLEVRGAA